MKRRFFDGDRVIDVQFECVVPPSVLRPDALAMLGTGRLWLDGVAVNSVTLSDGTRLEGERWA